MWYKRVLRKSNTHLLIHSQYLKFRFLHSIFITFLSRWSLSFNKSLLLPICSYYVDDFIVGIKHFYSLYIKVKILGYIWITLCWLRDNLTVLIVICESPRYVWLRIFYLTSDNTQKLYPQYFSTTYNNLFTYLVLSFYF